MDKLVSVSQSSQYLKGQIAGVSRQVAARHPLPRLPNAMHRVSHEEDGAVDGPEERRHLQVTEFSSDRLTQSHMTRLQLHASPAVASASSPPPPSPWPPCRPRRRTSWATRRWRSARRRRPSAACCCSAEPGRWRCGTAGCRAKCRTAQRPGSRQSSACRRPSPAGASGRCRRSAPSACTGPRLGQDKTIKF